MTLIAPLVLPFLIQLIRSEYLTEQGLHYRLMVKAQKMRHLYTPVFKTHSHSGICDVYQLCCIHIHVTRFNSQTFGALTHKHNHWDGQEPKSKELHCSGSSVPSPHPTLSVFPLSIRLYSDGARMPFSSQSSWGECWWQRGKAKTISQTCTTQAITS